jgi:hypothetical protein
MIETYLQLFQKALAVPTILYNWIIHSISKFDKIPYSKNTFASISDFKLGLTTPYTDASDPIAKSSMGYVK